MLSGGPNQPALAPKLAASLSRAVRDPLFSHKRTPAQGPPPLFGGSSRFLLLFNAVALLAIAGGVAFGIAASGPPARVLEQEAAIIAVGLVYATAAVWVRSLPWGGMLLVRLFLVFVNVALVVAALGVAGPWLQGEFPPLAVAAFAALLLYWDSGYGAGQIGYVLLIAAAGLGLLWVEAIGTLMVPIASVLVWSLVLLGLVLFAYVTRHVVDRNLVTQSGRQGSLLAAVSDLGEGLVITEDGRFVTGNEAYITLTGYSADELAALPSLIDLAPSDQRDVLTDQLAKRLGGSSDVPVHYESALVTKDGRRIQIETSIRPLTAEGPRRLLAVVRDVTDRHRSEEAERESETRFRTLFEQSQAGMAFADLNGRLTSTNEAFRQLVGYTAQELVGVSVLELTHPEDLMASEGALRRVLAGETPGYRIDKRYIRKDGQSVWVDVAARLVRDAEGKAVYLQTVAVDIRDRMRGEVLQSARFAVTQALVTSPGWDKAAPHVLEGLCRALDWELGEYWEVDASREAMHFAVSWKRPGRDTSAYEATASQFTYRRGEGLAGHVWEESRPVSLTDLAKDPSPRSAAALAVGLHGLVGFPVRSGRRVVGMISLGAARARRGPAGRDERHRLADRRVRRAEARRGCSAGEREAHAFSARQRVRRARHPGPGGHDRLDQPRGEPAVRLRREGACRTEGRRAHRDDAPRIVHELRRAQAHAGPASIRRSRDHGQAQEREPVSARVPGQLGAGRGAPPLHRDGARHLGAQGAYGRAGVPGAARLVDRTAQPHAFRRPAATGAARRPPQPDDVRRPAARPRPLQGHQRRARP